MQTRIEVSYSLENFNLTNKLTELSCKFDFQVFDRIHKIQLLKDKIKIGFSITSIFYYSKV